MTFINNIYPRMNSLISRIKVLLIFITIISLPVVCFSQIELVPVTNNIYEFINRQYLKGNIDKYNPGQLPKSREEISGYLIEIEKKKERLTGVEKEMLGDYLIEFNYEINKNLDKSVSIFPSIFNFSNYFENNKEKFLYAAADSNASFFLDLAGFLSFRRFNMESSKSTYIGLGDIGIRLRGSIYNSLGYYIRMSNGKQINGDVYARTVAALYDPRLKSTPKFLGEKFFDTFEGYLRFENEKRFFAVTLGRENILLGNGFIDKIFISNNSSPFDFGKIDINYYPFAYTFLYGNLRGDSLGTPLTSKNIISHKLDVNFSRKLRIGFFESIITSNTPLSFTYMNPFNFLTAADFSSQIGNKNNSFMGLDIQYNALQNISLQATLLVDDIDFKYLFNNKSRVNSNKFAWQVGLTYCDPFGIPNNDIAIEFTHIDPFVYSHFTNKSTYANWSLPIGHSLPPNSDEIAVKYNFNITNRLILECIYKFQRSGTGFLKDPNGAIIKNYGNDINYGTGMMLAKTNFLEGDRIDRDIIIINLNYEPIKGIYFILHYNGYRINYITQKKKVFDNIFYLTTQIDI